MSAAGSQELGCKDWLCCWWECAGTGCDSVAAFGEAVGSSMRAEACDAPWDSGKQHRQTLKWQGSFARLEEEPEPC